MKDDTPMFSWRFIAIYAAVALFVILVMLSRIWEPNSGVITDNFSGERWTVVIVAAIAGLGLGWMIWPRGLSFVSDDEDK